MEWIWFEQRYERGAGWRIDRLTKVGSGWASRETLYDRLTYGELEDCWDFVLDELLDVLRAEQDPARRLPLTAPLSVELVVDPTSSH